MRKIDLRIKSTVVASEGILLERVRSHLNELRLIGEKNLKEHICVV